MKFSIIALLALQFLFVSCGKKGDQDPGLLTAAYGVIGEDNRVELTEVKGLNARVGLLIGYNSKTGDKYSCSATLIHYRMVLTAAHCVISQEGVHRDLSFIPGALPDYNWRNRYRAQRVYINKGYLKNIIGPNRAIPLSVIGHDMALVELEDLGSSKNAGDSFGFYGVWGKSNLESHLSVSTIGYPGDKKYSTPYMINNCDVYYDLGNVYTTNCDVFRGQSGSPVLSFDSRYGKSFLRGVFSAEASDENYVAMLTKELQDSILAIFNEESQGIFSKIEVRRSGDYTDFIFHNNCDQDMYMVLYADTKGNGSKESSGLYLLPANKTSKVKTIYGKTVYYYLRNKADTMRLSGDEYRSQTAAGMGGRGFREKVLEKGNAVSRIKFSCQ